MPRDLCPPADIDQANARFAGDPLGAIAFATSAAFGPTALVSSFGAESAVLLHMAAQVDRHLPVIFIDTLLLFPETLTYQRDLVAHLGLTNMRRIVPDPVDLDLHDPDIALHGIDPDACCALRKARTLDRALAPFASWITGRKRFQNTQRAGLSVFEADPTSGKIKINPLAGFMQHDLSAYLDQHDLPRHPLVAGGYPSIGCTPCTSRVRPDEDPRAGRWRGQPKTECGIHFSGGQALRGQTA